MNQPKTTRLRNTLLILSGISLAGLLIGCAIPTKEDIARSTTEFNLVAEKLGNETLYEIL